MLCENSETIRYKKAWEYIVNDSINKDKIMVVSDSIVDIDPSWFSNVGDLDDYPNLVSYIEENRREKQRWIFYENPPVYSSCFRTLFPKKKKFDHIVFFSAIEKNMLRIDLLPFDKSQINVKYINPFYYERMARFTEGYMYLFIFEENGLIKNVFGREIIYD